MGYNFAGDNRKRRLKRRKRNDRRKQFKRKDASNPAERIREVMTETLLKVFRLLYLK